LAQAIAKGAYVEAVSKRDTTVVYLSATDTSGQFDLGPLPAGDYTVRALIDQNANRVFDRNEKWDSVSVTVTTTRPSVDLNAIERDSVPPAISDVTVGDDHLRQTARSCDSTPAGARCPEACRLLGDRGQPCRMGIGISASTCRRRFRATSRLPASGRREPASRRRTAEAERRASTAGTAKTEIAPS
jgi:hypothetical protein